MRIVMFGSFSFRVFYSASFFYMELSWISLDGSTASSWYKARPGTMNPLWILVGTIQERQWFLEGEWPLPRGLKLMLQYYGVLLLQVFLLSSQVILPKCNCHICGNYSSLKIQSLNNSLLIHVSPPGNVWTCIPVTVKDAQWCCKIK